MTLTGTSFVFSGGTMRLYNYENTAGTFANLQACSKKRPARMGPALPGIICTRLI